jgi:TIR domain/Effector-associated domain 11
MLDAIRSLIGQSKTREALEALTEFLRTRDKDLFNECFAQLGRFNLASQTYRRDGIDYEEYTRQINRINFALIEMLQQAEREFLTSVEKTTLQKINATSSQSLFTYDVFLSFSSIEKEAALPIFERLTQAGIKTFFSGETLKEHSGQAFSEIITNALENSQHFILFCSPHAMQSHWVKIEWESFFNEFHVKDAHNRRFFILKGADFEQVKVPMLLRRLQYADDVQNIIRVFEIEFSKQEQLEKERIEQLKQEQAAAELTESLKQEQVDAGRTERLKQEQAEKEQIERLKLKQADAERTERWKHVQIDAERTKSLNEEKTETEKRIISPYILETQPKPSFFQKNRVAVISGSSIAAAVLIWQLTKSGTPPLYVEQNKPVLKTEQPEKDILKTKNEAVKAEDSTTSPIAVVVRKIKKNDPLPKKPLESVSKLPNQPTQEPPKLSLNKATLKILLTRAKSELSSEDYIDARKSLEEALKLVALSTAQKNRLNSAKTAIASGDYDDAKADIVKILGEL